MEPAQIDRMDEAAVRDDHATLTRILGAIEEYVYTGELLHDGSYRVVFAGPCREQFLGLSIEAARTAVWSHYVHPDDVERFDEAHDGAQEHGRLDVDYRLIGADGVVRWVRDRGRIREEDGRRFLDGSILDVTEVHMAQEQLQQARLEAHHLAHVDPLTGAANRRSLAALLAPEDARTLGFLSVDLDRFKQVNDLFGHAAGDAVLVAVAERLRACVRSDDAVLRMGGEEFLVLIRGVQDDAALLQIGEAIRRRIEASPVVVGDELLAVTVSVGASLAPADGKGDLEANLIQADQALYEAKRGGRNRVRLASQSPSADGGGAAAADTETLRIARAVAVTAGAAAGLAQDHFDSVSELAALVARRMGHSSPEIARCRLAGLVHDVGKLRVPQPVLTKPGRLDAGEWAQMRAHSVHGEAILAEIPELRVLARVVRHHHERFDGGGYPDGLAGAAIPIEARIIAAADTWSAMRSDRPYRPALDEEHARQELRAIAGTQLDPDVVAALEDVLTAADPGMPLAA